MVNFKGQTCSEIDFFYHFHHFPIFRLHESDLGVARSPATEFSGPWGLAGTKIHTLTTFWPEDIKIQRGDPEKPSKNLPRPYFFQTTKPWPTTRWGKRKIALDGSLIIRFYRLYKPFSGPWGFAGTKIHTLTTFWPKDIKIQQRNPRKSSINLPSPFFFQTTKLRSICRRVNRVLL